MADKGKYPEHLNLLIDRLKLPIFKECLAIFGRRLSVATERLGGSTDKTSLLD